MQRVRHASARGWRRVPGPLAALLGILTVLGVCWALIVPPWQSPDSVAHFAYTQSIAERLVLPGAKGRGEVSSEQGTADALVGASNIAFYAGGLFPNWSPAASATYARHPVGSRTDGGGPNPAAVNPPLYYLLTAVPYRIAYSGDIFSRLYAVQLLGVLMLLGTAVGAWLLAGEVLGPRRVPQLACAAVVGLIPMVAFDSTSVNPDALLITLTTFFLWLGARVINRGASRRDCVGLGAVCAAAILTKGTSYALLPAYALALGLGWLAHPRAERRRVLRQIAFGLAALAVPVLVWLLYAHLSGRQVLNTVSSAHPAQLSVTGFLSYLWQFYLPKLWFLTAFFPNEKALPVYSVWLNQGWGLFGWLDVGLAPWLYGLLAGITGAVAVVGLGLLTRLRSLGALRILAFLLVAMVVMLAGLHWTEYVSIARGEGPLLQGRYLLPLVGIFGLAVGLIVSRLPRRGGAMACSLIVPALLVLQVVALADVARTYYS